jgi:hypothetical protein
VDLGTESIRTLTRKLDGYRAILAEDEGLFGWTALTLVLVADRLTPGRRQSLERLLEQRCPVDWVLWSLESPIAPLVWSLLGRYENLPLPTPLAARGGAQG